MNGNRTVVIPNDTVVVSVLDTSTRVVSLPGGPGPPGPAGPRLGEFAPVDHNLFTWAYDPSCASAGFAVVAGQMQQVRLRLDEAATVAGIMLGVNTGAASLVAGQCLVYLYDHAGNLVGVSGDQAAAWATPGAKPADLIGGPFDLDPGDYYACWHFNGPAAPQFLRQSGLSWAGNINVGTDLRYGVATGPYTTTAPATRPVASAQISLWAALYGTVVADLPALPGEGGPGPDDGPVRPLGGRII